jgi:hypothetical protein
MAACVERRKRLIDDIEHRCDEFGRDSLGIGCVEFRFPLEPRQLFTLVARIEPALELTRRVYYDARQIRRWERGQRAY